MARSTGILCSHNLILTQDNPIAPSRPISPPPISYAPRRYTFSSRPAVIESLRPEINRLSESTTDPYMVTFV
jgi:hypothetical protein